MYVQELAFLFNFFCLVCHFAYFSSPLRVAHVQSQSGSFKAQTQNIVVVRFRDIFYFNLSFKLRLNDVWVLLKQHGWKSINNVNVLNWNASACPGVVFPSQLTEALAAVEVEVMLMEVAIIFVDSWLWSKSISQKKS